MIRVETVQDTVLIVQLVLEEVAHIEQFREVHLVSCQRKIYVRVQMTVIAGGARQQIRNR